ncbi:MAG: tripartite tricarboxylate transporter substrate binding protein [Betaproteobacteria bacterium]|nr:tripartite tricarboxylate transporter substrate binding protein [Betaproteobacteria bacterium]
MSKNHSALGAYLIALMFAGCGAAYAQATYPTKPIRIVTAAAGGGGDFSARILAQGLTNSFGQQVIVDNRGGGNGIIAAQTVTKSPADGYTLLLYPNPLWLLPFLQDNVPYDPVKDFAPISLTDSAPNVLVVHPSLPVKSVRELISLAKARPGELNYSRASAGSPVHLAAELFMAMAGVTIVPVPYKGGGPAVLALLAGEVELSFASLGASGAAAITSKRLRALAVTSAEPSPLFPGLPTMAASGLPGFEAVSVKGLFAPAGTPASIVNRLNREVVQILRRPEIKERFLNSGAEIVGTSPGEFESFLKSDMAKWGKLIKAAKIRGD